MFSGSSWKDSSLEAIQIVSRYMRWLWHRHLLRPPTPEWERSTVMVSVSVYLHVCPRAYFRNYTSKFHQIFCASCLWSWLGYPLVALQYITYFRFCGWRHVFILHGLNAGVLLTALLRGIGYLLHKRRRYSELKLIQKSRPVDWEEWCLISELLDGRGLELY